MKESRVFAEPREVKRREECFFYHTMELPGYGLIKGDWDLRGDLETYLGRTDFRGKRVFDVGCASGFLTFFMERQGAEVVSYDLCDDDELEPAFGQVSEVVPGTKHGGYLRLLNNSYWLAHQALGSKAKMVYGTVYDIPKEIGSFDISVVACLLLHVRDPLWF